MIISSPHLLAQSDAIDSVLEPHNAWVVSLSNLFYAPLRDTMLIEESG